MAILIFFTILIAFEILAFLALKSLSKKSKKSTFAWLFYTIWTLFVWGGLIYAMQNRAKFSDPKLMNPAFVFIGFWLMNVISKTILSVFYIINQFINLFRSKQKETISASRRNFITKTGLAVASIPFFGLFYGMVKGRYNFKVWKQDIAIKNLPDAFVGKTIVQLSDMHLGSFPQGEKAVAKAIEMVNELNPDYIFFTGDMINERAIEAEPWVEVIKNLKAKYGKFSILGNHDYGSYYDEWAGDIDKIQENIGQLKSLQEKMGFRLLRNENILLKHDNQSIRLIGLENWGKGFSQYGDLQKATAGVGEDEVQILLSHDPSHWEEQVLGKTKIDLALAGHTHGAQMGVELPAFRWSPVKYRYSRWAGHYMERGQQLYVNRGFGYIGYAGRIGIWPEITLLTLQKA